MVIVRGVREGRGHTTNPDRLHADWWQVIWELVEDWEPGTFLASHVKAHRKREAISNEDEEGIRWWHGNRRPSGSEEVEVQVVLLQEWGGSRREVV